MDIYNALGLIFIGLLILYIVKLINSVTKKSEEINLITGTKNYLEAELKTIKNREESLRDKYEEQIQIISTLQANENHLNQLYKMQKEEFEALSRQIMEENRTKLMGENSRNINLLLEPLKQEIAKLGNNHKDYLRGSATLQNEIKNIIAMNQQLSQQSNNLANALRGDKKLQGNWGEFQLEKLLELSGLTKDVDYILQAKDLSLRNDDNKIARPDVIINLPENKKIIIDAKVSLVSYEKYYNTSLNVSTDEQDTYKDAYLKEFINAIKSHIDSLSGKSYHYLEKLWTPEYTIMFMPIESAYMLAISTSTDLHEYAISKNIILVSTNNLIAILRTIAHMLSFEKRNKNAEEIARQAGLMYDKFAGFVEEIEKIGVHIQKSQDAYNESYKKLSSGRDNLLSKAEKLKNLGAKTNKTINSQGEIHPEEFEEKLY